MFGVPDFNGDGSSNFLDLESWRMVDESARKMAAQPTQAAPTATPEHKAATPTPPLSRDIKLYPDKHVAKDSVPSSILAMAPGHERDVAKKAWLTYNNASWTMLSGDELTVAQCQRLNDIHLPAETDPTSREYMMCTDSQVMYGIAKFEAEKTGAWVTPDITDEQVAELLAAHTSDDGWTEEVQAARELAFRRYRAFPASIRMGDRTHHVLAGLGIWPQGLTPRGRYRYGVPMDPRLIMDDDLPESVWSMEPGPERDRLFSAFLMYCDRQWLIFPDSDEQSALREMGIDPLLPCIIGGEGTYRRTLTMKGRRRMEAVIAEAKRVGAWLTPDLDYACETGILARFKKYPDSTPELEEARSRALFLYRTHPEQIHRGDATHRIIADMGFWPQGLAV
ncbi:MAG: hypothetical protein LKI25_00300 [Atopobiaceae bacterium]|jgi:hypothetical protein|nr:hypothetical protein [Atopobiaceae bacterium]MCI2172652.1 hypothetical protein [Atopobiaceae bacterium]MCI2206959.1 hypothetical protein [Atopobiaceae bacterium]